MLDKRLNKTALDMCMFLVYQCTHIEILICISCLSNFLYNHIYTFIFIYIYTYVILDIPE